MKKMQEKSRDTSLSVESPPFLLWNDVYSETWLRRFRGKTMLILIRFVALL